MKIYILYTMRPESGCWMAANWPYIEKKTTRHRLPKWRYHQFFWRCRVSLVKFSYWSKFHVSIITGSRVMTIFVYKELIKNSEIGNTLIWVLSHTCRLGQVSDTKFDTNFSSIKLLNTEKRQGYSFHHLWVIKGKPTGIGKITPHPD